MKKSMILLFIATSILIMILLAMGCSPSGGSSGGGGGGGGDGTAPVDYNAMVSVAGGTYDQESGVYNGTEYVVDESFSHTVSSFQIGKYEVTYELWYTVYQWAILPANGYFFANAGREGNDGTIGAESTAAKHEPVTTINWRDAIVWCNAYSEMEGLTPVYDENGSSAVIKDSRDSNAVKCDAAIPDWTANGYRLPTEGEWQFAASNKGGTPFNYAAGATDTYHNNDETKRVSWGVDNSGGTTHNAGTRDPNQLAINDMSGNVLELCWDWEGIYPAGPETNYRGASTGTNRIVRGGNYGYGGFNLTVGNRLLSDPGNTHIAKGFRIARTN